MPGQLLRADGSFDSLILQFLVTPVLERPTWRHLFIDEQNPHYQQVVTAEWNASQEASPPFLRPVNRLVRLTLPPQPRKAQPSRVPGGSGYRNVTRHIISVESSFLLLFWSGKGRIMGFRASVNKLPCIKVKNVQQHTFCQRLASKQAVSNATFLLGLRCSFSRGSRLFPA